MYKNSSIIVIIFLLIIWISLVYYSEDEFLQNQLKMYKLLKILYI